MNTEKQPDKAATERHEFECTAFDGKTCGRKLYENGGVRGCGELPDAPIHQVSTGAVEGDVPKRRLRCAHCEGELMSVHVDLGTTCIAFADTRIGSHASAEKIARALLPLFDPWRIDMEKVVKDATAIIAPHLNASPSPVEVVEKMRDEWQAQKSNEVKLDPANPTVEYVMLRDQIIAANLIIAELKKESQ